MKTSTTNVYGSQNFLLGKAMEDEKFRLLIRSHLGQMQPISEDHKKLIQALMQETWSYVDLVRMHGAQFCGFALGLANDYARQKITADQFAKAQS